MVQVVTMALSMLGGFFFSLSAVGLWQMRLERWLPSPYELLEFFREPGVILSEDKLYQLLLNRKQHSVSRELFDRRFRQLVDEDCLRRIHSVRTGVWEYRLTDGGRKELATYRQEQARRARYEPLPA